MNVSFALRLAAREGRATLRRVGVHALSISLGVAALVAVQGVRSDVAHAIDHQAQVLLGADARLESDRPFPPPVEALIDSLARGGVEGARIVRTVSMIAAEPSGAVRLMQLGAVEGGWPFAGSVHATPAGSWPVTDPGEVVVDRAALGLLGVDLGDVLTIGGRSFVIGGWVEGLPADPGFQSAVGPRVWLTEAALEATDLLGFGSLARWEHYLRFPAEGGTDGGGGASALGDRHAELLAEGGVRYQTATERARALTRGVDLLGRYLGLVGLGAVLLGGLGVGSAIHLFVRRRLTTVAILRCLGARQTEVFAVYLIQAVAIGVAGAVVGVGLGLGAQAGLPGLVSRVLPLEIEPVVRLDIALLGLGVGVWVAVVFALLPLLAVVDVPPLRALRASEGEGGRKWRTSETAAVGLLAASVVGLAVVEAPTVRDGILFAGGLALVVGGLWAVARLTMAMARRVVPSGAPYPWRQGVSNLFRPGNQTVAAIVAVGLGAFLVATILQVQQNVARELALDQEAGHPDLLLFDVQPEQREGVIEALPPGARAEATATPLVSARLIAIDGVGVEVLGARDGPDHPEEWTLHREYRHSWREGLAAGERVVAGAWWPEAPPVDAGVARISVEVDLARELGVTPGSRMTWSVAGRSVESEVVSLRSVEWDRFQTNFFVVFEPGALDDAPATWVVLARVADPDSLTAVQRRLIERYPNVSALDLGHIQAVVGSILGAARQAVLTLGAFAALAGMGVLAGTIAASRLHRLREGALLRTLGARKGQLRAVFLAEFVALGLVAAVSALGLATLAAWLLVTHGFGLPFAADPGLLGAIAGVLVSLTLGAGWVGGRGLLRRPPLTLLRLHTE